MRWELRTYGKSVRFAVEQLVKHGGRSFEESAVFIGGTKFEANVDRYTFVWKRRVTKEQIKLREKIAVELPGLLKMGAVGIVVPKQITV